MPGYAGTGQAQLIRENRQVYLFNQETNFGQKASIAVNLERVRSVSYPWGMSIEFWFSGDPGVFEIDIQDADLDIDSHYCTLQIVNSTAQLNASFVGRYEVTNFWARYIRVYVKTLTNAVAFSAVITR